GRRSAASTDKRRSRHHAALVAGRKIPAVPALDRKRRQARSATTRNAADGRRRFLCFYRFAERRWRSGLGARRKKHRVHKRCERGGPCETGIEEKRGILLCQDSRLRRGFGGQGGEQGNANSGEQSGLRARERRARDYARGVSERQRRLRRSKTSDPYLDRDRARERRRESETAPAHYRPLR